MNEQRNMLALLEWSPYWGGGGPNLGSSTASNNQGPGVTNSKICREICMTTPLSLLEKALFLENLLITETKDHEKWGKF